MYCKFYGFLEKPFDVTPDPKFLYLSPSHREVLAALTYGIKERRGFMAVVGEVGTGKTTLLNTLLDKLDERTKVAYIFNTDASFKEILLMALVDLGILGPNERISKIEALHRLNDFAIKQMAEGGNVVLIIDEAQNLDPRSMENLRLLSNLETRKHKLIQIVLSGQPELEEKLADPKLRQFTQRISLKRYVEPLSEEETYAYIDHRLKISKYRGPGLFNSEAKKLVWEYSRGIPRKINILCDNTFLIGYGLHKKKIGTSIVIEAVNDLNLRRGGGNDETKSEIVELKQSPPMIVEKREKRRLGLAAGIVLAISCGSVMGILFGYSWQNIQGKDGSPVLLKETVATMTESSEKIIPQVVIERPKSPGREVSPSTEKLKKETAGPPIDPIRMSEAATMRIPQTKDNGNQSGLKEKKSFADKRMEKLIVKKGDTLSAIIQGKYGRYDESMLNRVLKKNPEIRNPEIISVGQIIRMPLDSEFESN